MEIYQPLYIHYSCHAYVTPQGDAGSNGAPGFPGRLVSRVKKDCLPDTTLNPMYHFFMFFDLSTHRDLLGYLGQPDCLELMESQ